MIEVIKKQIAGSEPFKRLIWESGMLESGKALRIQGLHGSLKAFVAASLFEAGQNQILLIAPDKDRAEQLRDDCSLLLGDAEVHLYVSGPSHVSKLLDMSAPIAQMEALFALSRSEHIVVVASAEAVSVRLPLPAYFAERIIELEIDHEYPFEELIRKISGLGFVKKDFVEEYGDFAVRGGILDVFPYLGDNPIRFEFWGDKIESIREFDALSQRSIRELRKANIAPGLYDEKENAPGDRGYQIASNEFTSFFRYFSREALLLLDDPLLIGKEIDELVQEGHAGIFDWRYLKEQMKEFRQIVHSSLKDNDFAYKIDFKSLAQPPVAGSVKRLIGQLRIASEHGYQVYISCDTKEEGDRLNELIEEEITSPDRLSAGDRTREFGDLNAEADDRDEGGVPVQFQILTETMHSGFIYPSAGIALFTEHEIFGRLKRRGSTKGKKFRGFTQKEIQQLQRGDYVVHQDHGIGRFAGLQKIKVRGVETEVMRLQYDENDVLYVNLNFINRVQKYASQEGHIPKLHKLGGPDWERLKSRARRKIKDIARDLIKLYARRKHENGVAFKPDTHWQKEMEASFLYEDTPDQAKATLDVKSDMEQSSPMDRLICGDVGFGKTEVAVRAAFKAVMNNKQVAVLVPTTILAQQHFNTFLDRIGRYSVRIEMLSRFRAKKEQEEVIRALKEGKVDVLIGTHRLLSKDIGFRDIGLLIIDEEQRFGVAAKEKLRQLRASVDTLTLTATPIPRTLQFSLMGARDLSLINTPPRNRIPIQTEIAQFDPQIIREAILKELHRGGQIYFVHDRVQDIDRVRLMLEELVPKTRLRVAHGQMKGHDLEKAMIDFLEKKFDVLICTKIIESGIDIPSVNTIIINRADRFGLAELYQLRGRVGRSNVQAYAYLLTPPLSTLPRLTLRRLQAIQEFTELGSGFNLAMRDLEIRGAGNLLGGEQSGFILEMGFDMYQRVVEEAVAELKEEEFQEIIDDKIKEVRENQKDVIIETDIEALIPDFYIEHDSERLDIYRRLYRYESFEEIDTMRKELQDRFGEYPEEVENLFRLIELKIIAAKAGFVKVELSGEMLTFSFPPPEEKKFYEGEDASFQKIVSRFPDLKQFHPHLKQEGRELKLQARISGKEENQKRLYLLKEFLTAVIT